MRRMWKADPAGVLILDVDGTVVDSNDAHADAWMDAFAEAGVQVDRARVRRAIGMGGDMLLPHVSGISKESPQGSRISARRGEIFKATYLPHVQPLPGARELVERAVRDGLTIVVASSAQEDELGPLLDTAGVAHLVDARTSGDDAEHSKPAPDIVQAALQRVGAARECAVMLGDTPYDVEGANRAGVPILCVESGGWRREELQGAAAVYAGPAELLARYDTSLLRALAARARRRRTGAPSASVWTLAAPLLGAGAFLLIWLYMQHQQRRQATLAALECVSRTPPGLGPQERAELRDLLEDA